MFTYLILDAIVLATILAVMLRSPVKLSLKRVGLLLAVLLVLTAIFDSLMIAAGLFAYSSEKILGLSIGKAPLEDFAYTIAASIFVPYVWIRSKRRDDQN